jgi:nucleoside-triphosphatase
MPLKSAKILLTGTPGCGKTTAIIHMLENLKGTKAVGFYTQEIREKNVRKGFKWCRLDGNEGILAHVDMKKTPKVGKYGVNVAGFEKSVVPILDIKDSDAELFIIDEIGNMECLSEKFVVLVRQLFASDKSVLATVAQKGAGFVSEVKNYPNVELFNLSRKYNNVIIAEILQSLSLSNATP